MSSIDVSAPAAVHRAWLEAKRGLDIEIVMRLGIGSHGERIAFPVQTPDGSVVAYKLLLPNGKGNEKWRTATISDTPGLFNGEVIADETAAKNGTCLIVTEGELDCMVAVMAGFPHSVSGAHGAATSTSDSRLDAFRVDAMQEWGCIILATDADEKGLLYRDTLASLFDEARCRFVAYPEGCKDLNDVLLKHGIEAVTKCLNEAKEFPLEGVFRLDDYPEQEISAYATDLPGLNALYRPFRGGMTVLAGISSHGKSTFLTSVLGDMISRFGLRACVASFEEPIKPFYRDRLRRYHRGRAAGVRTVKDSHAKGLQLSHVPLTPEQTASADQWIRDHFVFMDRSASANGDLPTVDWFLEMADKALTRFGYDILVLDPWNKLDIEIGRDPIRAEKLALNRIKAFARRRDIILFVVTHPNRSVYDGKGGAREPSMSDIAGGTHWEAMADHIVIVHRQDRSKARTDIKIDKVKWFSTGKLGGISLIYNRNCETFFPSPEASDHHSLALIGEAGQDGLGGAVADEQQLAEQVPL